MGIKIGKKALLGIFAVADSLLLAGCIKLCQQIMRKKAEESIIDTVIAEEKTENEEGI
ncbi:MAG: hypothetical protein K6G22_05205 [Lachnospiraceae bacterium]|nr:hypothetical protein [Lachnospiraceae bacterium]